MHKIPKSLRLIVAAVAVLGTGMALHAAACAGASPSLPRAATSQSPFYCDEAALAPAERTRHFKVLGPALAAKRHAVRALSEGYELSSRRMSRRINNWSNGSEASAPAALSST